MRRTRYVATLMTLALIVVACGVWRWGETKTPNAGGSENLKEPLQGWGRLIAFLRAFIARERHRPAARIPA